MRRLHWYWLLPVLLVAMGLAARHLQTDAYSADEAASMIVAGGGHYGPFTPAQAWQRVAEHSPDQAVGLALVLSSWGRLVGWSELATRALALVAGLLTIALVYRLGRNLFNPAAGLSAALILTVSTFFLTYMHIIRVFTLAALMVTLTLWCYWRVVLNPRPPGWLPQIGLLVGGIGLFYTHYFATLFIGALGIYHLLFARRSRWWWRAILIFLLALVVFLPELRIFLTGYERNLGNTSLHAGAMSPGLTFQTLIYVFTNGLPVIPAESIIWLLIPLAGLAIYYRRRAPSLSLLLVLTLLLLALILGANSAVQLLTPGRWRYLMPVWPLLALLVGVIFSGLLHWRRWLGLALLGFWTLFGVWTYLTTPFGYQLDEFSRYPLHDFQAEWIQHASADDLLIIHGLGYGNGRPREFYTGSAPHRQILQASDSRERLTGLVTGVQRVWTLVTAEARADNPAVAEALQTVLEGDFVHCYQPLNRQRLMVDLYARVQAFCPSDKVLWQFGTGIAVIGLEPPVIDEDRLLIRIGWSIDRDVPPNTYSAALHLYHDDEFIMSGDYGLPPAPFGPAESALDIHDLPSAIYTVRLGVYDWATGEHLYTTTGSEQIELATLTLP